MLPALQQNDGGQRFKPLMSAPPRRHRTGLHLFQGLLRGYDANDVAAETAAVKAELRRLRRLIDKICLENDRQKVAARKALPLRMGLGPI